MLLGAATVASGQTVESPTTVSPGSWLVEADVVAGLWDSFSLNGVSVSVQEVVLAPFILSTGVLERLDFQIAFDGWVEAEVEVGGRTERVSGWGDVVLRTKWNFYGDEEAGSAWAVMPHLKLPVADSQIGNGEVEGGATLLYGQPLGEHDWMQAFVSGDSLRSDLAGRDEQLVAGVIWGHNFSDRTTVYTEVVAEWFSAADSQVPVVWGIGVSPVVAPGFALDFEVLAGITEEAPDWGGAIRIVWEL
jgi:hypothetical protein